MLILEHARQEQDQEDEPAENPLANKPFFSAERRRQRETTIRRMRGQEHA